MSWQIMTSGDEPQKGEKRVKEPSQSTEAITSAVEENPGLRGLHVVRRQGKLLDGDDFQNEITGFDASHMGARATLSVEEEKRLLRRIDWHLLPLLAVMYMVKTIDASNVRAHFRNSTS